jgi:hypothetical protein
MNPSLSRGCPGRTASVPLSAADFLAMAAAYPSAALLPPGMPTGLWSSVVGSTVALQWHWSATGGAPSAYELRVGSRRGRSDLGVIPVSSTAIVVPDVPGGVYFVRLVARNAAGSSAPTADLAIRVAPASLDSAGPRATASAVALAWLPVADDLMPVSYLVLAGHAPGVGSYQLPASGPSLTVPDVSPGTYYVRVVAVGQAGLSPLTPEVAVVVPPQR